MFTWGFWEKALERAIRAFAWGFIGGGTGQVVLPALPIPAELVVEGPPTLSSMLLLALYVGTVAAVLSLGASMGATRTGNPHDPSLLPTAPETGPQNPPASSSRHETLDA